jgi:hypothetical protein
LSSGQLEFADISVAGRSAHERGTSRAANCELEPRQTDLILGTLPDIACASQHVDTEERELSSVLIDRFDPWVGDIGEFKGQRSRASTYITGCGG